MADPKYDSSDEATIKRHIQQAQDAGIDALICAWFGPNEPRLDKNCRKLMDLIEQTGSPLKVAIMPEQAAWKDLNSVDGLSNALGVLRNQFIDCPSYFRFKGKPAVYYFGVDSMGGPSPWQQLRDRADPNRDMFWFGGSSDFKTYFDVFDTLYFFDITWEKQSGAAMNSYVANMNAQNKAKGTSKPLVSTVMPGYDDIKQPAMAT